VEFLREDQPALIHLDHITSEFFFLSSILVEPRPVRNLKIDIPNDLQLVGGKCAEALDVATGEHGRVLKRRLWANPNNALNWDQRLPKTTYVLALSGFGQFKIAVKKLPVDCFARIR
jgi:hypothetical protein